MFKAVLRTLLGPRTTVGTTNEAERDAWVKTRLLELPSDQRLLDAGAGMQPYRKFCTHLRYVAQDFAKYDGKGNQAGLQIAQWDQSNLDLVCDIMHIPEPDGAFDNILCTEVLEHVPDPVGVVAELSRLLRPGGKLIVTAPFASLTHFAPYHFSSGFSRYFYEKVFPDKGLHIVELTASGSYFHFLAQELRRLPSIAEQYAGVRPGLLQAAVQHLALVFLQRCASRDKDSSTLLAYGYFVIAQKNI